MYRKRIQISKRRPRKAQTNLIIRSKIKGFKRGK